MALKRWGMVAVGVLALIAGAVALSGVALHGKMELVPPVATGVLAVVGVALLFLALIDARKRAHALEAQAAELQSLTAQLEDSLKTVSAINARLHESEVRYKGLVDSQGDAIFRRDASSRLTYGNVAFFKLFGLHDWLCVVLPLAFIGAALIGVVPAIAPVGVSAAGTVNWRRRAPERPSKTRTQSGCPT